MPGSPRALLLVLALVVLVAACRSSSDVGVTRRRCPVEIGACLAWDDFDRAGTVETASTGQRWSTWAENCPSCNGPELRSDGDDVSVIPSNDEIQVWLATVDTGRATGVRVAADVTTSSTPLRANVGLIALFEDAQNHLDCKIEVSEGHPDGLMAIGDEFADRTTSLLASADDLGFENGRTYHVELMVPDSLGSHPVRCRVTGSGIRPTTIAYRLSAAQIDAYGRGTGQGLRIKIFDDEDDGGSSWDDFAVRPLA